MGASTALQSMFGLILLVVCWSASILPSCGVMGASFPAFFIFGDSLVDAGNNNYITTIARATNLPFGIDFPGGPTGRFCNGKTVADLLSEKLSLPYPPPYLAPTTRGQAILQGVNYASAAAGILRFTGINFVGRVDMDTQLSWYGNTVEELRQQKGKAAADELLARSLFGTVIGANDYVNNYLVRGSPTPLRYTPPQFQELLLSKFATQLTELFSMGARTILVIAIGPIGCIPSQLARRSVNGECSSYVNSLGYNFNEGLKLLVSNLNSQLVGSNFIYVDVFNPVLAYRSNPQQYGFKFGAEACCGAGRFNGQALCLPFIKPCQNRTEYVFWDAFHPTESTNRLLANTLIKLL